MEAGRSRKKDGDERKHGRRWEDVEAGRMRRKAERGWREREGVAESGRRWHETVGSGREPGGQGDTRNSIKGLAGVIIEPKTILLEFIIATPIALVRQNAFY